MAKKIMVLFLLFLMVFASMSVAFATCSHKPADYNNVFKLWYSCNNQVVEPPSADQHQYSTNPLKYCNRHTYKCYCHCKCGGCGETIS